MRQKQIFKVSALIFAHIRQFCAKIFFCCKQRTYICTKINKVCNFKESDYD